jgi:hypothetical protein
MSDYYKGFRQLICSFWDNQKRCCVVEWIPWRGIDLGIVTSENRVMDVESDSLGSGRYRFREDSCRLCWGSNFAMERRAKVSIQTRRSWCEEFTWTNKMSYL